MSVFIPLIILFLVMFTQVFLQVSPATFSIFYHYAIGKKSAKSASDLSLYYILGSECFSVLFFIIIYMIVSAIFCNLPESAVDIFAFIMSGIAAALSILSFFCYYKKGKTAALFLPRPTADQLVTCAKSVKKKSDAFLLGAFSNTLELPFTFSLYVIFALASTVMESPLLPRCILVIAYVIVIILPLFIMRAAFRSGRNLADITRFRIKKKPLFRILISVDFLLTAIATLILGVIK